MKSKQKEEVENYVLITLGNKNWQHVWWDVTCFVVSTSALRTSLQFSVYFGYFGELITNKNILKTVILSFSLKLEIQLNEHVFIIFTSTCWLSSRLSRVELQAQATRIRLASRFNRGSGSNYTMGTRLWLAAIKT